jgi:transcriptional regulator with XRE-family HTH domain
VRRAEEDVADGYEHTADLRALIVRLKGERLRQGLSLGDVARQTTQARSAISRLETGEYVNPTLHTLYRYARALGWQVRLGLARVRDEPAGDVRGNEGGPTPKQERDGDVDHRAD